MTNNQEILCVALAEGTIQSIYSGKNTDCRCGCCGKYYRRGDRSFHRIMNEAMKIAFNNPDVVEECGCGINILRENGKAFTIYFAD